MKITIPLNPVTKKNSQQIIRAGNRAMVIPSKAYKQYLDDCRKIVRAPDVPIDYPVNVKALYYMKTRRRVDISNLHSGLHDVLVALGIVEDDHSGIIAATDGSRVLYDKENPRTEITVEAFDQEEG